MGLISDFSVSIKATIAYIDSMTSPTREISRKLSVTRSYSSDLGTVREEHEDVENNMDTTSVFERSLAAQQPHEEPSSGSDTGNIMGSFRTSPSLREVMKTKIKYHYMNPFQKFRARRRKPWKLVVQIVKILLITLQVRFDDLKKLHKTLSFLSEDVSSE